MRKRLGLCQTRTFTKGFGGKYLQEESDGWSSLGACPHQSHSAETNSRTSLDQVLQLHHCAHFHWGEAYVVLKLSGHIYSEMLETERKYGLWEPELEDPGES